MAKKTYDYELVPLKDAKGNVIKVAARSVEMGKPTRHQRKSMTEMPFTKGPGASRTKRLMRDLFG